MSILNSVKKIMQGFGSGSSTGAVAGGYATAAAVSLSGGTAQTTAVTMGTQGYTNGRVRVKIYNGGGANTSAIVQVQVSDGTNTYYLNGPFSALVIANGANSGLDFLFEVLVDISISTVNIITTLGGTTTTASMDYEVCLNP